MGYLPAHADKYPELFVGSVTLRFHCPLPKGSEGNFHKAGSLEELKASKNESCFCVRFFAAECLVFFSSEQCSLEREDTETS